MITAKIIDNALKTYDPRELYNCEPVFDLKKLFSKREKQKDNPDRNKKIRIK